MANTQHTHGVKKEKRKSKRRDNSNRILEAGDTWIGSNQLGITKKSVY